MPRGYQDCVALICAAGEAKAQVVQRAVEVWGRADGRIKGKARDFLGISMEIPLRAQTRDGEKNAKPRSQTKPAKPNEASEAKRSQTKPNEASEAKRS